MISGGRPEGLVPDSPVDGDRVFVRFPVFVVSGVLGCDDEIVSVALSQCLLIVRQSRYEVFKSPLKQTLYDHTGEDKLHRLMVEG
jgi:hypothetical protein